MKIPLAGPYTEALIKAREALAAALKFSREDDLVDMHDQAYYALKTIDKLFKNPPPLAPRTVWIVQEETGGIPYEPMVFWTEKEAVAAYIRLVNENQGTKYTTFKGAARCADEHSQAGDDWFIRLWEI